MLAVTLVGLQARAAESDGTTETPSISVEISGIEDPLLTNVRRFLGIAELDEGFIESLTADDGTEVTERLIRRRHQAAPGEIRHALMPYGYYRPAIDSDLESSDGDFVARYRIDPGEPTTLDQVSVRAEGAGSTFPAVRQVLDDVELESGERLVHSEYEAVKSALYDAAYDNGFLDAAWQVNQIRVAPDRAQADIELVLDTGSRFYFGPTTIEQDVLDPQFVAEFVDIRQGAPYDVDQLLDLQRSLSDTDYFSRVEVQAPRGAADDRRQVPVTVRAEPAKSQKYTVGLGYGTDTGPRGKLGVLVRRLNDRGHRLRADIQLSGIEQALGARYEIPIRNYATDMVAFHATARREEIGDADTDRISVGGSHMVGWLGFRRRLYLQAEREHFSFGDGPTEETDLLSPGITLSRERSDSITYPRRGYSVRADLRGGSADVLSDVSFSRLELTLSWTRALGPDTRLLLRGEAGALWTDSFDRLPPSQRFFAGGDRSIRGYPFREVGPQNADGDVIGGERLLTSSAELEHLFHGNYGAAVFVDAGDAFMNSLDIKVGAGIGFRWRSPVGMVRFDVAHPFDDPNDDYRIHLTIGADL